MAAGRPTEYTPELLEKAREYATLAAKGALGNGRALPSIAELALSLGISRETVYAWGREKPEFSDILEKILAAQELQLTTNGLTGDYNAAITKLMLTKHGYVDKQDVTSGGKELPVPIIKLSDKE